MTWSGPLTDPCTHPLTRAPTCRWGSLHGFQIFKQNWNILISSNPIEFLLSQGFGGGLGGYMGVWGWCKDLLNDMGMTGMMWGQQGWCGDHGDHEITKNAITFEQIEIIQFCLKIWDPWTLIHTYSLHLMYRWGCPIPNGTFMQKVLLWPSNKNFSCFCTGSR